MQRLKRFIFAMILLPGAALGVDSVGLELNKTEQRGQSCRVYLLIENGSGLSFETFKLEMVLFDKAGIIDKNMALDIAPLRRDKKRVTAFDVKDIQCGDMGAILVNKIMQCRAEAGGEPDCLSLLKLSTRTDIALTK